MKRIFLILFLYTPYTVGQPDLGWRMFDLVFPDNYSLGTNWFIGKISKLTFEAP